MFFSWLMCKIIFDEKNEVDVYIEKQELIGACFCYNYFCEKNMIFFSQKDESCLLANILPKLAEDNGWQKMLKQYALFSQWSSIVGEDVAEHATPLKIMQNVLWLEVENSVWMQQLQYQKILILQTCNEFLPESPFSDIRLVLKDKRQNEQNHNQGVKFIVPSENEIKAFERIAATIKDKDCREALMQFWYLSHVCNRV